MTHKTVTRIESPPFLSLRLLAAASWASWFAIQWCRVFEVGDPGTLKWMFFTYLLLAILTSLIAYASEGVAQVKDE